jgi:hypothetical protein
VLTRRHASAAQTDDFHKSPCAQGSQHLNRYAVDPRTQKTRRERRREHDSIRRCHTDDVDTQHRHKLCLPFKLCPNRCPANVRVLPRNGEIQGIGSEILEGSIEVGVWADERGAQATNHFVGGYHSHSH